VELGHHQATGPGEVDLFLPLRDARRLQPLCGGLDGGPSGERHARAEVHRRDVRPPGHQPWAAHHPRRSRARDDLEIGGALTRRPRRDQDPRPAACLQRQPIFGSAVQDAEVPAGLPGAVRLDPGCPRPLPHLLPLVQRRHHHSGLGLLTPHDVHFGLAEQRVAARATVLATAYAVHPERFPRGLPRPPARPEAVWINPPKLPAAEETRGLAATRGGVLDHARPGQVFSAHRSDLDRRGCVEAPA
jgi:hypothetical protein